MTHRNIYISDWLSPDRGAGDISVQAAGDGSYGVAELDSRSLIHITVGNSATVMLRITQAEANALASALRWAFAQRQEDAA